MVYDRWVRLSVMVRVSLSVMLSSWGFRSATCTPGSIAICVKFLQIADVFDEFLVSCRTTRGFLRKPVGANPQDPDGGLHLVRSGKSGNRGAIRRRIVSAGVRISTATRFRYWAEPSSTARNAS